MPETQTIQSTSAPWGPLQPYLTSGFSEAQRLYGQGGPSYFPNSTVAPFGADTVNALSSFRNQATSDASPYFASRQLNNTLNNGYLNSNPYLDQVYGSAAAPVTRHYQEAVAPTIGANFGMSGRSGSPAYMNAMASSRDQLGRTLGDLSANIYGNNYQQERGRQMQALQLAPAITDNAYTNARQLLNVGNMFDNKAQQNIDDQFQRHQFNELRPYENLGRYQGYLGGNYGQQNSETRPIYQDNTARNVGLGLTGLGLLSDISQNGGIGGLLGGLF